MVIEHPDEETIQQFVLGEQGCGASVIIHITKCENCKAKAASYRLLFAGIKEQPKPAFEFDVAQLILQKLPSPERAFSLNDHFIYFICFTAFTFLGVFAVWFRKDLSKIFDGVAPMTIYLMLVPITGMLIMQCWDLYKKYRKQIATLG